MKRIITLLLLAFSMSAAIGCKKDKASAQTEASDPESEKTAIFAVADKFHKAFKAKKPQDIKALTIENGFYMGTDPDEVFSQLAFEKYLIEKLTNPAIGTIDYKIDRREVIFEDNGAGAVLVDQFKPIAFTQYVSWRMATHLVKKDGAWKFDFISLSMIPKNDVVPAVNAAAYQGN